MLKHNQVHLFKYSTYSYEVHVLLLEYFYFMQLYFYSSTMIHFLLFHCTCYSTIFI